MATVWAGHAAGVRRPPSWARAPPVRGLAAHQPLGDPPPPPPHPFPPPGGGVKYYLAEIHSIDRFHITLVLVQSLHCRLVGFREANSSHTSLMLQSRQAYLKTGSGYGKFLKLVHFFSQLVKGNPANWRRR